MAEVIDTVLAWKAVAVFTWIVLLVVAERLVPSAPWPASTTDARSGAWTGWRRLVRNGVFWIINSGLSPAVIVPITAYAASLAFWQRPDWWGGPLGLLLDLLLLDLFIYWWHRANHEVPVLWRFHEVHHLDEFLDASSALRFHFGELILSAFVRGAFIVALAVPLTSVLVFEALVLVAALFHHSNIRLPRRVEQALARIVITPSIHWVHHHAVRRDTDSNYGTVLSVWDPLFGTRSATRRTPDMRIGVEGRRERRLLRLILRPFVERA